MSAFLASLISDWRRKLLALMFGFGLWWWIEGRIAIYDEVKLTVAFSTEEIGTPDDFQLLIQAPEGWVLTSPRIDSAITVWLNGSKSELQSFTTKQCAARLVVNFNARPDESLVNYPVGPADLDWMRPSDAELLLANVPDERKVLKSLTFERVKQETVRLTPSEILVSGNPSQAHEVRTEQLSFTPNTVKLTGPQMVLDQLLAKVNEAHSADGRSNNSELLNVLEIPEGTRDDVTHPQELNSQWQRLGIQMDPATVFVRAKVRIKEPASIEFHPTLEDLQVRRARDPAEADIWELAWEPEPWWASLPHVENDRMSLSETWVQEHVMLVVPLHNLKTDGNLDSRKVRIEAHIVGFADPAEQSFYEQHLVIGPKAGSGNDIITVKRKP